MDHNSVHAQLENAIARKMLEAHGAGSITHLASGSHHDNFLLEVRNEDGQIHHFVVRVPIVDKPSGRTRMHKEHIVLQHLDRVGFWNAPKSYVYDATLEYLPFPYAIQSFVASAKSKAIAHGRVDEVAAVVARLHNVDTAHLFGPGLSPYATPFEQFTVEMRDVRDLMCRTVAASYPSGIEPIFEEAWRNVSKLIHAFAPMFEDKTVKRVLIHGDLGAHNIGWALSGPILFDWEIAAISDPARDIAKLFRNDLRSQQQCQAFLATYWNDRWESPEDVFTKRIDLYEYLAALQNTIWLFGVLLGQKAIRPNDRTLEDFRINLSFIDPMLTQDAESILVRLGVRY